MHFSPSWTPQPSNVSIGSILNSNPPGSVEQIQTTPMNPVVNAVGGYGAPPSAQTDSRTPYTPNTPGTPFHERDGLMPQPQLQ